MWAWEEESLQECRALLLDVPLFPNVSDTYVWLPDPSEGYSVQGAYELLTSHGTPLVDSAMDLIWHNQVPLKVSVFAWRLLHDRLPAKANLAVRGVIPTYATSCVSRCGHIETTQHLFLSCPTFASLWQ